MLDITLVEQLRDKLTKENVYKVLKENSDISTWNSLCSSLDWLAFGVEIYNNIKVENKSWKQEAAYKEVLEIIMSADIVVENSINILKYFKKYQSSYDMFLLHIEKNKEYLKYFYKKGFDDLMVFKKIRAIFGAHNIDIYGVNKNKFFAGWPTNELTKTKSDWECRIYREIPETQDTEPIYYGFDINELKRYVEYIYNLLRSVI